MRGELWSASGNEQIHPEWLHASGGSALNTLCKEGATRDPLRRDFGGREESTEVAKPRGANEGICHSMEDNIAIRVPDQRRTLGEGAATEVQRAAGADWVRIIAPPNANPAPW
jgi:hypothetical protein